jgi:hypothetical protein
VVKEAYTIPKILMMKTKGVKKHEASANKPTE